MFETALMQVCGYLSRLYIDEITQSHPISDANRELIIGFYRGESFGLIMDWMMRGMPDDVLTYFHQICVFRHGMSEEMLTRMVQSDK